MSEKYERLTKNLNTAFLPETIEPDPEEQIPYWEFVDGEPTGEFTDPILWE